MCTINKSAHMKKSLETYLMILVHGTSVTANNSTNNNLMFFFVSIFKIVFYINY